MPQVAIPAVLSGAVSSGVAFFTSAAIGTAFVSAFATTFVLGAISQALTRSNRSPGFSLNGGGGVPVTVRQPDAPRQVIYGSTRASGVLTFMSSTKNGQMLHMVIAMADHEVEAINTVYLDDVDSEASGVYRYNSLIQSNLEFIPDPVDPQKGILRHDLAPSSFASFFPGDLTVIELGGVSSTSVNQGVYRKLSANQDPPIFVGGGRGEGDTIPSTKESMRVERIDGGPDIVAETSNFTQLEEKYVFVNKHLGGPGQVVDPDLLRLPEITSTMSYDGIAYIYVRLAWTTNVFKTGSPDLWRTGVPNITADIDGNNQILDDRTSTVGFTDNAALVIADYIRNSQYGLADTGNIDAADVITAANICDEVVPTLAGTENRYQINGGFQLTSNGKQVLNAMRTAIAGKITWQGGRWRIKPGVYIAPTISFDESDMRGELQVQTKISRREIFNAVKGTYISAQDDYLQTDFPAQVSTTAAVEDGETIFTDIELPFTTRASTAQRLARIHLLKARQQISAVLPMKIHAVRAVVGDIVNITNDRMGWVNKPFEIESLDLIFEPEELGIDVSVREIAADVYDWNTGLEQAQDPAPNTNLPDPYDIPAVTGLTALSGEDQLLQQGDGTLISRINLFWDQPTNGNVTRYEVDWRLTNQQPSVNFQQAQSRINQYFIAPVIDGQEYEIQVRQVNLFAASAPASIMHTVVGKTSPPPDVQNFLVFRQPDGTREFSWTLPNPPLDLAGYQIRYNLGSTIIPWESQTILQTEGLIPNSPFESNQLAAGTYVFCIKAFDTTGNESVNPVHIIATLGDPRLRNALAFEDVAKSKFPGNKTFCFVDPFSCDLLPVSQLTWDTLSSVGGINTWDDWKTWSGGFPATSLIYEHTVIDVGTITSVTPLISVNTPNSGAVTTIEIRESDDNISFSAYAAAGPPVSGRYFQVRVSVTTPGDEGITGMTITLDADIVIDDILDLDTTGLAPAGVGVFRVPLNKSFTFIQTVFVAIQNVSETTTYSIIDKSTTGPLIEIRDSNSNLVDAVVDVEVKGL